jgi:hypothetical protein
MARDWVMKTPWIRHEDGEAEVGQRRKAAHLTRAPEFS